MTTTTIDKLSLDTLANIFVWAVRLSTQTYDRCPRCRQPFQFVLDHPMARSIRGVCLRWRLAYLHRVLLPSLNNKSSSAFCNTPSLCSTIFWDRVLHQSSWFRPVMHLVTRFNKESRFIIPDDSSADSSDDTSRDDSALSSSESSWEEL